MKVSNFRFRNFCTSRLYTSSDTFITKIDHLTQEQPKSQYEEFQMKRVAVKDNVVTINEIKTTCASEHLANFQSPFEAEVLVKLKQFGEYRLIGKTKMDEFGMGSNSNNSMWGPARRSSPSLKEFSPGGSSGGSAVAVADYCCDLGIGTDTGGSVRLPAAYTGIVGFKPSYGLISRWGIIPYANSLDTVGFLTRTVKESEEAFRRTTGYDFRDPTSLSSKDREKISNRSHNVTTCSDLQAKDIYLTSKFPRFLSEMTIGFPLEYNITELDPYIRHVWKLILKLLQKAGAKVVPVSLPTTKYALPVYYILAPAEAASNLAKYDGIRYGDSRFDFKNNEDVLYSKTRGETLGPEVRRRIILGSYTLSSEQINNYFIQAQKVRRLVQRDFNRVFQLQNPLREPEQFDMSQLHEDIPLADKLGPKRVDYIICPTAANFPQRLQDVHRESPVETYLNDIFTVPASLAGLPALSVPVKLLDTDLFAVGIQIIGQYGEDSGVLRLGNQLEQLTDYLKSSQTRGTASSK